jgi:acylphosphatase
VFYRSSAQREALRLGLRGEVRNLPDGRVQVIAEGEKPAVEALIAWCRQGPPSARVESVDVRWETATNQFPTFRVAR